MGRHDEIKQRRRSRSRSRSRDKHAEKGRKRRTEKRYSLSRSLSPSPDRKKKHHSKSVEKPTKSRSSSESSSSSDSSSSRSSSSSDDRRHKSKKQSKSHKKSSKSKKRSRSIERSKRPLTQEEIAKLKERKRYEKELVKAVETPEEKRSRRLAKKEAKEKKRKEQMGWDAEYMGYTNGDNPFGDEHLLDTFHWSKKLEKEGLDDLTSAEVERLQKKKMMENKLELEKVKKRRLEREREMEERERDREQMQREKETEYYSAWEKQEDQFHLQQAKLRSKIRIEDGRAKPIDLLAKYISAEDDDLAIEMHEPYTYLNGLTIQDLEDLLEDIKVYIELEQGKNVDYWKDITIISDDELKKLKKIDPSHSGYIGDRRSGINTAVTGEVNSVFKGKTLPQLAILGENIKKKLVGGEGVDISYWESLLQQLRAHMATTRIKERHQEQLRRKLYKLKQEQGIDSNPLFPILREGRGRSGSPAIERLSQNGSRPSSRTGSPKPSTASPKPVSVPSPKPSTSAAAPAGASSEQPGSSKEGESKDKEESGGDASEEEEVPIIREQDIEDQAYLDYDAGRYSPKLMTNPELEPDTLVYDPEDDIKRLEYARRQLAILGKAREETDDEMVKKAREGMTNEEAQFSVEVPLEQTALLWSDKYRPRKPRFFNRVHTGFEWNKYNQTHYDIDNPPPKIVQGYKFNIFYPDLIDKTKTPEYYLTPCEDNKDFAALRFHAGPPYEDIAFKIVNREWEYSYKRGFRCQFHNNIFQLWFHFKRYRYRR